MSDTSTRSGMLWEVERILTECKELGSLPQILLMENVVQVHSSATDKSKGNVEDFNKWQLRLEELGYKNYWEDLIATDYGIPQTRNRCFMVSIFGDYSYSFPPKQPLKLKLKDMLEDNVDEKYYLSDAMIKCFTRETDDDKFPRGNRFKQALKLTNEKNLAGTITTAAGNRATDNFILTKDTENYIEWEDGKNIQMNCRAWKDDKVVATLNTGGETKILTNKSLQETLESNKIDDTCYIDSNYLAPTIKENHGTINATQTNDLRIRKLTPKECFRLMGVKDEDFEKIAKSQSDSSLYHLAGDSIVVNVLTAIFKELL